MLNFVIRNLIAPAMCQYKSIKFNNKVLNRVKLQCCFLAFFLSPFLWLHMSYVNVTVK